MRKCYLLISMLILGASLSGFGQYHKVHHKSSKNTDKTSKYANTEEEEEDSVRTWEFGVNLGGYFANKFSANFYNGVPTNVNTVNYVMSNKYWYQDIKRALGSADTVIVYPPSSYSNSYPMNMHYTAGFAGGLFLRYNIDHKSGIFLQADYAMLKTTDVLLVEVDPKSYITTPDLRYLPITGKEGRVLIDLGYQRSFPLESKIYFYLQAAATMCYTQVIKSYFHVGDVDYSIINVYGPGSPGYVPGGSSQTININQNTFGFGGMIGAGVGIPLNDNFGIEPGGFMHYYPTNLTHYEDFKPSFGLILRILMNFSKSGDK